MILQVPREALEFTGKSINFRSGEFGYSICPVFSKGHAEIFCEFEHDFAKNRTYGVLATNACYHACFMICCKGTNWSLLLLIRDGEKQPPPLCDTAVRVGCFRVLHYHTWDFSIIHDAGI